MKFTTKALGLLAAAAAFAGQAGAQIVVDFTTTGVFAGGAGYTVLGGGSIVQFGGIQLSYAAPIVGVVNTPSNTSLGEITASCIGGGTACAFTALPSGLTLTVSVTQSLPFAAGPTPLPTLTFGQITFGNVFTAGAGGIGGSQSTVTANTSTTPIFFGPTATPGGTTTTSFQFSNVNYDIVPPSTNGGVTSLQGRVDAQFTPTQTTPEPASLALMASGMIALGGFGLRRRRSA